MRVNISKTKLEQLRKSFPTLQIKKVSYSKLDHDDWSKLSSDMITYGIRDVDLTHYMYNFFKSQPNYPSESVLDLEHEAARIIAEQERFGFYFDIDTATNMANDMLFEKFNLEKKLQKQFGTKILPDGPVKETKGYRRKVYIPNKEYKGWYL